MKIVLRALFLRIAGIAATSAACAQTAQTPAPRYLKKAVFIRVWYDQAFLDWWQSRDVNSQVESWFNEMRAQYKNDVLLQNVDIFLLKDNYPLDPQQNPFIGPNAYFDPLHNVADDPARNQVGGNTRLLNRMRDAFSTGPSTKVSRQTTYALGLASTINVLFVHQIYGQTSAAVYEIGNLGSAHANLFVSTLTGPSRRSPTAAQPTDVGTEIGRDTIIQNLGHEIGHLLGGKHELADGCPTAGKLIGGELMCSSTQRAWEFGPRNALAVTNVIKSALSRCNSAFSSKSSCEQFVDNNLCLNTSPYDQIAFCSGGCEGQSLQRHLHERSQVGRKPHKVAARHHQRTAVIRGL